MWFVWALMWCLWKAPSYDKIDYATDPYAQEKWDAAFADARSCFHPYVPYENAQLLTYLEAVRGGQADRLCDTSNPNSKCYPDEQAEYDEAQKWIIQLDDGTEYDRAPAGMIWGLVLVLLLIFVIFVVRSMALASANKEVSQIGKAKAGSMFLMTYIALVVLVILEWVLLWLTLGKYSTGAMAYVMENIVGGLVYLLVDFHWTQSVRSWGQA